MHRFREEKTQHRKPLGSSTETLLKPVNPINLDQIKLGNIRYDSEFEAGQWPVDLS